MNGRTSHPTAQSFKYPATSVPRHSQELERRTIQEAVTEAHGWVQRQACSVVLPLCSPSLLQKRMRQLNKTDRPFEPWSPELLTAQLKLGSKGEVRVLFLVVDEVELYT